MDRRRFLLTAKEATMSTFRKTIGTIGLTLVMALPAIGPLCQHE
jgi:hypothetical protein